MSNWNQYINGYDVTDEADNIMICQRDHIFFVSFISSSRTASRLLSDWTRLIVTEPTVMQFLLNLLRLFWCGKPQYMPCFFSILLKSVWHHPVTNHRYTASHLHSHSFGIVMETVIVQLVIICRHSSWRHHSTAPCAGWIAVVRERNPVVLHIEAVRTLNTTHQTARWNQGCTRWCESLRAHGPWSRTSSRCGESNMSRMTVSNAADIEIWGEITEDLQHYSLRAVIATVDRLIHRHHISCLGVSNHSIMHHFLYNRWHERQIWNRSKVLHIRSVQANLLE